MTSEAAEAPVWPTHADGSNMTIGEMSPQDRRAQVKAAVARVMGRLPKPECPYCGATEGLRMVHDGGGFTAPEYTCEADFTAPDDGPCFDDLPHVPGSKEQLTDALNGMIGLCQLVRSRVDCPQPIWASLTYNHRITAAHDALRAAGVEVAGELAVGS